MNFNLKVLAAVLSELEGKSISKNTAWHIIKKPESGRNATRLLNALPAYKVALQKQCEEGQDGFGELENRLRDLNRQYEVIRAEKAVKAFAAAIKRTQRKICLIAGEEQHFDRVTRRKLRGAAAEKYKYIGAGEVVELFGWQSKKFKVGDKALFWKLKNK